MATSGTNPFLRFEGRGFSLWERLEILHFVSTKSLDANTAATQKLALAGAPSHHQKSVLVDYGHAGAVGFVMGHNSLDEYWDKSDHSTQRKAANQGRNGNAPRQDISSKVSGPILEPLHLNFAQAWKNETGEDLVALRPKPSTNMEDYANASEMGMAQLVRTQPQHDARDIERLYLQATNNLCSFAYIENQYFRWPPLAEKIQKAAQAQIDAGRTTPLHLFVVTNSSDEGIGAGTVKTAQMLEALGRADAIPEVARAERVDHLPDEIKTLRSRAKKTKDPEECAKLEKEADAKQAKLDEAQNGQIAPEAIPGLKIHVCTLVAPDSPPGAWVDTYVHAKLMIVNDVFTTLGSANINTRSMEVDSELNIAHESKALSQQLRRDLWKIHTKTQDGIKGAQDDPVEAFKAWELILGQNNQNKALKDIPYAPLIGFLRTDGKRTNLD